MNNLLPSFAGWLQGTWWGVWISSSSWVYPFVQATHFIGLSFWLGTNVAVDLRLLGLGKKRETAAELSENLFILNWIGFGVAIFGGFLLFSSSATTFITNPAFRIKLGILVPTALITHIVVQRRARVWGAAAEVSGAGKVWGLIELLLWISTVTSAVAIPYFE
jgi:hypothetical protein